MGYDVYIVRKTDYDNYEEESNISLDEWRDYVKNDSELILSEDAGPFWNERPGYCEWLGHSIHNQGNDRPLFGYWRGSICTKNPDTEIIRKMIEISLVLTARVEGQEGEYYDEDFYENDLSILYTQTPAVPDSQQKKSSQKPWWKFW